MVFGSSKKNDKQVKDSTSFQYERTSTVEETKPASFIGKTMKIEGELFSEEDLIIEGQVNGIIEASKTLTIGRNGIVTADIHAGTVKISGKVKGNITATEKVAILAEGNFNGNIKSQKLAVAEGAILIGDINKEVETLSETKPIPIPEIDQESQSESMKKYSPKSAKKKIHTQTTQTVQTENPEQEAEQIEQEVIDAELE